MLFRFAAIFSRHHGTKTGEHDRTFGQRSADWIANGMGSWTFLIAQTVAISGWIILNVVGWCRHWDEYPFILLNLLFSTQAAYAAPVILMSSNRAAERDRRTFEETLKVAREDLAADRADLAKEGEVLERLARIEALLSGK